MALFHVIQLASCHPACFTSSSLLHVTCLFHVILSEAKDLASPAAQAEMPLLSWRPLQNAERERSLA